MGEMRTPEEQQHLEAFDDLDFRVFSQAKWDELGKSHAPDITVHWPDGHTTQGLEKHIQDLAWMFSFAPDTKIKEHPIKLADGPWTAVVGVMEMTFTEPMKRPDGRTIQPTGKHLKLQMVTVGHWIDGQMDEEYLFWDNDAFNKQLGII